MGAHAREIVGGRQMIALVIVFCHFAEPVECKIVRLVPES